MSEAVDVAEVALLVAAAFRKAGIDYVLGGSVASSLQGEPRSTNDIDFAVRLSEPQVSTLAAALGPDFSVDEEALRAAVRAGRSENIFFLPLVTKVDLFVRGGEPFDESEFARRQEATLRAGAPPMYVASPEDNLLRKLAWYRLGQESSDRQWRDVLGLLRISGARMDQQYLQRWASALGVSDLLARATASTPP